MTACLIEGCEKPAGRPGTARGWCSTHYSRWQRTGDPLLSRSDLKPKPSPICAVEGCERPRWARGWCDRHYQRWRARGEPGSADREWLPNRGLRCSVPGCRKWAQTKQMCKAHALRAYRHGDPLAGASSPRVGCMVRSCEREHYALGLCNPHWSVTTAGRRRGARLKRTIPGTCTPAQLVGRVDYYGGKCWMCGQPAAEIDHVKPLSRGGSNWPANIRPACHACNMHKMSRWPLEKVLPLVRTRVAA